LLLWSQSFFIRIPALNATIPHGYLVAGVVLNFGVACYPTGKIPVSL